MAFGTGKGCWHFISAPFVLPVLNFWLHIVFLASENIDFTGLAHVFLLGGGEACLSFWVSPSFRLKCSGRAKPPLHNSPLRSEFTPHLRRSPEGPCRGLGCNLELGAGLKACSQNCMSAPQYANMNPFVVKNVCLVNDETEPRFHDLGSVSLWKQTIQVLLKTSKAKRNAFILYWASWCLYVLKF